MDHGIGGREGGVAHFDPIKSCACGRDFNSLPPSAPNAELFESVLKVDRRVLLNDHEAEGVPRKFGALMSQRRYFIANQDAPIYFELLFPNPRDLRDLQINTS
jgi:hypothetical protein